MQYATQKPVVLWVASLATLAGVYTLVSVRAQRPDLVPPPAAIAETFTALLRHAPAAAPADDPHAHHHHMPSSDQGQTLVQEGVTLPEWLLVSSAPVLFGLVIGGPLGILIGVILGWSRRADDYLHPVYVPGRPVP